MAKSYDLSFLSKTPAELLSFLKGYTSSLKSGQYFVPDVVTYSFYTNAAPPSDKILSYVPNGESASFTPFTAEEQAQTRGMLEFLSRIVNLEFVEAPAGQGLVRLGHHNMEPDGYANYPNSGRGYGVVFVDNAQVETEYFTHILWHEFGHALGLSHPNDYEVSNASGGLLKTLDTTVLTTMSYNSYDYLLSDGPLDIATLIEIYGASHSTEGINYLFNTGSSVRQAFVGNDYHLTVPNGDTFWACGTRGVDTIDVSSCAGTNGIRVDAVLGAVAWHLPADGTIQIYDFAAGKDVSAKVSDFADLRVYPADGVKTYNIETLKLSNVADSIEVGNVFGRIDAAGGNDRFNGFSGSVFLEGGSGADQWVIDAALTNFEVSQNAAGIRIAQKNGSGAALLDGIESIRFTDAQLTVSVDPSLTQEQAYRLYKAAFDRQPDLEGLGFWIRALETGANLVQDVAQGFVNSAEFQTMYGVQSTDAQFVSQLYKNVLDRDAEGTGYQFWLDSLSKGVSRAQVLTDFSESTENQHNVAELIAHGIIYEMA